MCQCWITHWRKTFSTFPSFNSFFLIMFPPLSAFLSVFWSVSASPYHPLSFSRKQVQEGVSSTPTHTPTHPHTHTHTRIHTSCLMPSLLPPRLSLYQNLWPKHAEHFLSVLVAAASSVWGANIACRPCESQSRGALKPHNTGGHREACSFRKHLSERQEGCLSWGDLLLNILKRIIN